MVVEKRIFQGIAKMALKIVPSKQQIITVLTSLVIIAIATKVLPIPDQYKAWLRP